MKTKKTLTNNVKLAKIKYDTLQLNKNNQIPFCLTKLIMALNVDNSVDYVLLFVRLAEELIRVKGYYKRYPDANDTAKQVIDKALNEYFKKGGLI